MIYFKYLLPFFKTKSWLAFVAIGPFVAFIEKFVFDDWNYLQFLMVVVALDFITAVTKAWKDNIPISSKGWRNTVSKIIQYSAFLVCTHVTTHLEISGERVVTFDWIDEGAYVFLISIEIKSVYENIIGIDKRLDVFKPLVSRMEMLLFKRHDDSQS